MEINAFQTAPRASALNGNAQANGTSEKDLFMSLLVAQLKNQDPLSPQDGNEFVAQLAQFNSLDQLIGIRDAIERLTAMAEVTPATPSSNPKTLSGIE